MSDVDKWVKGRAFKAQSDAIEQCKKEGLAAHYEYPFITCNAKATLDHHIEKALQDAYELGRASLTSELNRLRQDNYRLSLRSE
jgi:hypothetical protein